MTTKDLLVMLALMAIIAIALAIDSIVATLPFIFLALGVSVSLVIVTVTSCVIRYRKWQLEQYEKLYIMQPQTRFRQIVSKFKLLK